MEIVINNNPVKVKIIRKSIKNVYFRIDDELNILVTANRFVSEREIGNMIKSKINEIAKMYVAKAQSKDNEAYFYYLGNKYNVIYDDKIKEVVFDNENVFTKDDKMLDKFYLHKCNELFTKILLEKKELFDNLPDFKIRYRKMKTRWGVCNITNKVVTLNTELLKKDKTLIDYVAIHELCHFYYPNHQKEFWDLVNKHYPYYKMARKMLKES